MPLFKKPESLIPPVSESVSSSITPRSSKTYVTRVGNATGNNNSSDLLANGYNGNRGIGDVYSRGTAELAKDRNELFSGYNPTKSGSGRFFDGSDVTDLAGEGGEDDVEAIKQQTRFVKQESVNSTRNALRLAREAEETGRNTLARLGEQSENLAETERHINKAKGHTLRAGDNTAEIKQLNRSIFRPTFVINKKAKRAAEEAKLLARSEEEREARAAVARRVYESHGNLGKGGEGGSVGLAAADREQRKRYQFESTASDDEEEDEMDNNLREIGEATKRLHALGIAMDNTLSQQNKWIDNIAGQTDRLDDQLQLTTARLKKIK